MAVKLAARRFGKRGAPLLLLHGLFGSSLNWQHIALRLAGHAAVLAVDLRNHGRSPAAATMDYPSVVEDLLALLDAEGIARATLVGHSMGGKAAMALALAQPARIARLVVIDIAPVAYPDVYTPLALAARGIDAAGLADRADADRRLAATIADPALRAMLLQNLVRDGDAWRWRIGWDGILAGMAALVGFPHAPVGTRRYDGAVHVLRGALSDHVRPEHEAGITALFPRARIDTLAGAGHWPHADRPGALADWLAATLFDSPQATCGQAASAPPNISP